MKFNIFKTFIIIKIIQNNTHQFIYIFLLINLDEKIQNQIL